MALRGRDSGGRLEAERLALTPDQHCTKHGARDALTHKKQHAARSFSGGSALSANKNSAKVC